MTDSEKLDLLLAEMSGMKQDITSMKQEMSGMKQDITSMKQEMSGMKQDITSMKQEMSGMKQDITGMKQEMSGMKQDITSMKQDMDLLKQKVSRVELILENEIRVNIMRVAEGHLDLSRNLHEAMKPSKEVEVLALKVRKLEADVESLKVKVG